VRIIASEKHELHHPSTELYGGQLVAPFERVDRWRYVAEALAEAGHQPAEDPGPVDLRRVGRIHTQPYLTLLAEAWDEWKAAGHQGEAIPSILPVPGFRRIEPRDIEGRLGHFCLAVETSIMSGTWEAACSSAAVALRSADLVAGGDEAFALCRPPGHHATADQYGGYCFLNNAAIAAQSLLDGGASRVAVVDVDFHHGNGTQHIFYDRDDVLFVSLHGDPADAFPHFSGYADETGSGAGEGFNRNYPMAPGTGYDEWAEALDDGLGQVIRYQPDALVVSLGVDTFERDPISFFKLASADFTDYGARIGRLGLPTLFVLEGGYAVEEIGINVAAVLDGYLNR